MARILVLAILLLVQPGFSILTTASAQDLAETPELVTDVVTGTPVEVAGGAGQGTLEITVRAVTEPLADATPTFRGRHWIGVQLQISNFGDVTASYSANETVLVDGEGFTYAPGGQYNVQIDEMPFLPVGSA